MQPVSPVFVTLHSSPGFGFHYYSSLSWAAGAFPKRNVTKWSLFTAEVSEFTSPSELVAATHSSNKTMEISKATLLVVKVELLGTADKISLWINPTLGAADPGPPDVTTMTTKSAAFRAFAFEGGGTDKTATSSNVLESALDEVRLGSSYSAVTSP
jgi:hypothetical protein